MLRKQYDWLLMVDQVIQLIFIQANLIVNHNKLYFVGASYLDFPANLLSARIPLNKIINKPKVSQPPIIFPNVQNIEAAAKLLINANKPLVVIGKGKNKIN